MRIAARLAAVALAAALAPPAAAQKQPRLGVGVGISSIEIASALSNTGTAAQIYLPINVSPRLRVEPQLGIFTMRDEADPSRDESTFTFGVGLLFLSQVAPQVLAYAGPRLAFSLVNTTQAVGPGFADVTGTDLRLAGAVGGEYQLAPRFSVGAEGQLGYLSMSARAVEGGGEIPGGSSWHTSALAFFRIFLF